MLTAIALKEEGQQKGEQARFSGTKLQKPMQDLQQKMKARRASTCCCCCHIQASYAVSANALGIEMQWYCYNLQVVRPLSFAAHRNM
jgi:TPP-dependent indolepyruvate ferredoxin oxidoreductase alpha subunit